MSARAMSQWPAPSGLLSDMPFPDTATNQLVRLRPEDCCLREIGLSDRFELVKMTELQGCLSSMQGLARLTASRSD